MLVSIRRVCAVLAGLSPRRCQSRIEYKCRMREPYFESATPGTPSQDSGCYGCGSARSSFGQAVLKMPPCNPFRGIISSSVYASQVAEVSAFAPRGAVSSRGRAIVRTPWRGCVVFLLGSLLHVRNAMPDSRSSSLSEAFRPRARHGLRPGHARMQHVVLSPSGAACGHSCCFPAARSLHGHGHDGLRRACARFWITKYRRFA